MRNHDLYLTFLIENFFFLYVFTTAPVFVSFHVFLALVQHSRVISLSDSVWGRQVREGHSGGVDGMDISVFDISSL